MIIFDDIISLIQKTGGINVLYEEIYDRLERDFISHRVCNYSEENIDIKNSRLLIPRRLNERYRDFPIEYIKTFKNPIFHSTYYRVPTRKICPVITTVHDFIYEKVIGGVKAAVHVWQKSKAIKNSDHLICVSNNTKEDLLNAYPFLEEDKVTVIYNGASDLFFKKNECRVLPRVLYVGQRHKYKNFVSLVYALEALNDLSLLCVGGGGFSPQEVLLLEKVLPGRYMHAGGVDTKTLNDIYNESFCFVYPSHYEGFGIPILESMKAGCPVIACNHSSIPEVSGDAAVLIQNGDAEQIYVALRSMFNMGFRSNLVKLGIDQGAKFNWNRTYSETLAVYRRFY